MLALARAAGVADPRVSFCRVDMFEWVPEGRYDAVFFGFWLSTSRSSDSSNSGRWSRDCLAPGGRVLFFDDAYRTARGADRGPGVLERSNGG